jgi:hypothetical protein
MIILYQQKPRLSGTRLSPICRREQVLEVVALLMTIRLAMTMMYIGMIVAIIEKKKPKSAGQLDVVEEVVLQQEHG